MKIKFLFIALFSFLVISNLPAQKANKKIVITGMVTDAQNRPISGALIMVDNKNTDILTNESGAYKVKVRPDADSITVLTLTNGVSSVAINSRTTINFTFGSSSLASQNNQENKKEDEVVNIGYGNVKKRDLLTQVNTIDGSTGKYAAYKDIYEILKGTPGVIVSGKNIRIQGPSSATLGTQPLFVVDGTTVQSIDQIAPYMIKNISVLKGSSASIYGSRGASGVILITTFGAEDSK